MSNFDHSRNHIMRQRAQNDNPGMNDEELARERERTSNSQARLQRKLDRGVQRMNEIQARREMEISQPGDTQEKEADEIAEKVSNGQSKEIASATPPPANNIHRKQDEQMAKSEDGALNGTAQLQAKLDSSKGSGQAMDDSTKSEMEGKMNADLSDVRIHTGTQAHEMAEGINAKAFTHGQDVYFKDGNYNPGSKDGKNLLAHELVHTQQQKGGVERKIQRFEAPGHEGAERTALTSGGKMTNEEASMVYFGNWMRDMNQVFVPAVADLGNDTVYTLISYLAMKKFGRTLTAEQFGYYIPAEHIDSPAGQVAGYDYMKSAPAVDSGLQTTPDRFGTTDANKFKPRENGQVTPQQSTDPSASVSDTIKAGIFSVDQTGVMAFMRRTNLHVEKRLEMAADKGRNADGMLHFGAALHAIEDLFAHSNYVEIAIDKILKADPTMLPSLTGADRSVQTLSASTTVNGVSRPVLTTGSFTGTDTMISVGSEAVKMLREGLAPAAGKEEKAAQDAFMGQFLKSIDKQVETNPAFKTSVIRALESVKVPSVVARNVVGTVSLYDIYYYTGVLASILSYIVPADIKALWAIVQDAIRAAISEYIMKPAADQLEARVLETKARDTSLIKGKKDHEETIAKKGKNAGTMKSLMGKVLGKSQSSIEMENMIDAGVHKNALDKTPSKVVAGPSHSQLSKDHGDSIFFGIAFRLAVEADKMLRDKMLAAWGDNTPEEDPDVKNYLNKKDSELDADGLEKKKVAQKRKEADDSSLKWGQSVFDKGHDEHMEGKYNLSKMRSDSAGTLHKVENGLSVIATAPATATQKLNYLQSLLRPADKKDNFQIIIDLMNDGIDAAKWITKKADDAAGKLQLLNISKGFGDAAAKVEKAKTLEEREAAYNELVKAREDFINWITQYGKNPTSSYAKVAFYTYATLFTILEREIAVVAPAYTTEQVKVLQSADNPLKQEKIDLPSLDGKKPAIKSLLETSRQILGHPYENNWWEVHVKDFMKKNPDQLAEEVRARNAGYMKFRE